jgi:hypothetical protein
MDVLGFMALLAITSYLAFRNTFFGLKIMAGCSWIAWVIYAIAHPPFSLTAGEGAHIAVIVVSIGIGLMVVLSGLGRGIKRSQDSSGNFTATSEGFQWKLPSWLKGSESQEKERRRQRDEGLTNYRSRIHRALHPNEGERRRR